MAVGLVEIRVEKITYQKAPASAAFIDKACTPQGSAGPRRVASSSSRDPKGQGALSIRGQRGAADLAPPRGKGPRPARMHGSCSRHSADAVVRNARPKPVARSVAQSRGVLEVVGSGDAAPPIPSSRERFSRPVAHRTSSTALAGRRADHAAWMDGPARLPVRDRRPGPGSSCAPCAVRANVAARKEETPSTRAVSCGGCRRGCRRAASPCRAKEAVAPRGVFRARRKPPGGAHRTTKLAFRRDHRKAHRRDHAMRMCDGSSWPLSRRVKDITSRGLPRSTRLSGIARPTRAGRIAWVSRDLPRAIGHHAASLPRRWAAKLKKRKQAS